MAVAGVVAQSFAVASASASGTSLVSRRTRTRNWRERRMGTCCEAGGCDAATTDLTNTPGLSSLQQSVQKYYGETLSTSKDLKTNACKTSKAPPKPVKDILKMVPSEVKEKYYGCGSPLPLGIDGLRVLDLGSGSGRDCFVAAALVGPKGSVIGVDMTPEQLDVARRNTQAFAEKLDYEPNIEFRQGTIEDLKAANIPDKSVDMIISNCVINLSQHKDQVLSEVSRVLADGGEFYFSDVYCDRRLPEALRTHEVLVGECIGGALYIEDFIRLARAAGFTDPRVLSRSPLDVVDKELQELVGEAKFESITYRLFKLPEGRLETLCEDYGQVATYKGTIEGHTSSYALDDHHKLEKGRPMLVCGNTASMLEETWLKPHFTVMGDRSTHFGLFGGCAPLPAANVPSEGNVGGGCC